MYHVKCPMLELSKCQNFYQWLYMFIVWFIGLNTGSLDLLTGGDFQSCLFQVTSLKTTCPWSFLSSQGNSGILQVFSMWPLLWTLLSKQCGRPKALKNGPCPVTNSFCVLACFLGCKAIRLDHPYPMPNSKDASDNCKGRGTQALYHPPCMFRIHISMFQRKDLHWLEANMFQSHCYWSRSVTKPVPVIAAEAGNRKHLELCMVAYTFNPSSQKAEEGGFQWVWGKPGLQSEY